MKILKKADFSNAFPMRIKCERVVDIYGFSYGKVADFCGSELEVDAEDIKKHAWFKYPDYEGVDYGVICPICKKFIPISEDKLPSCVLAIAELIRLNQN